MHANSAPRPTQAELEILQVLWQHGPSTVREVHDALQATRPSGYTSVLKFLQIMTDKGLVTRDASKRTHVYSPRNPKDQTQNQLVRDLLARAFDGSARALVVQALTAADVTADEVQQIRALLDQLEKEQG